MAGEVVGRMLTLREVCEALGISRRTAYTLIGRGALPVTPVRVGKSYRFSPNEVDRLVRGTERLERAINTEGAVL